MGLVDLSDFSGTHLYPYVQYSMVTVALRDSRFKHKSNCWNLERSWVAGLKMIWKEGWEAVAPNSSTDLAEQKW